MKCTGHYSGASLTLDGRMTITLEVNEKADVMEWVNHTDREKLMDIEVKPHRKKRSLDANAMLWACIGDMAKALNVPKERIYLKALRDYGQYEMMSCKKTAFPMFKRQYKDCEQVGYEYAHNGSVWIDIICYFGSHTYDTKQFSDLLDGVVSDMRELGLQPPPPKQIEEGLRLWEEKHHSVTGSSNT